MKIFSGKKAQASVISLWILVILAVLAVSIGHRVWLALRLCRYQKDKLKAVYLAKAGINRAIVEILNDKTPNYDTLSDNWADNENVFKKIILSENSEAFATANYPAKAGEPDQIKYGVQDEEKKINLNTAAKETLIALMEQFRIENPEEKTDYILTWRGEIPDEKKNYENLGYPCKADKFTKIEELALVKGLSPEDGQKLNNSLTVYTQGALNINTVSPETLTVFLRGLALKLSIEQSFSYSLADKIIELRNKAGYFKERNDIDIALTLDEEMNLFNNLMDSVTFQSDNFLIEVYAFVGKIKSRATAVYNRKNKCILSWHEG